MTCVAPYYDAEGLAGVAGIDCNPGARFRQADRRGAVKRDGRYLYQHSFIMEQATGKILFSTFKEVSTLAVKK